MSKKKKLKRAGLILSVVCIVLLMTGCHSSKINENKEKETNKNQEQAILKSIKYSNLKDKSVQDDLRKIMNEANISNQRQDVFFSYVDKFNNVVSEKSLAKDYEKIENPFCKYDSYEMQDEWTIAYPNFMGYNCRITAYSLFDDFINIPTNSKIRDDMVLMDIAALEEDNTAIKDKDELNKFKTLFSTISTKSTKDINEHVEILKKDWKNRGISFDESTLARLITVVFHDCTDNNDNYLFIGHTGILFSSNNKLFFVEKIAFQEPYQLTVFNNRIELNDYLMLRYDTNVGQSMAKPFIMENDELMKGYRQLPSKEKIDNGIKDEIKDEIKEPVTDNENTDRDTDKVSEVKGVVEEIKDFMFIVTDDKKVSYSFAFENKPKGLERVAVGDKVIVKYTGTVSEVDPFKGEILLVERVTK